MTYEIADATESHVAYGYLITDVTAGGAAETAGLRGENRQIIVSGQYVCVGGDIIVAANGTRTANTDELLTYLEENTLPGDTINLTIIRNNETMEIPVKLAGRE